MCTQEFEQTGTRLAQALTQKDSIARKKAAMSNDVAKALARLSSGLYIVTAAHQSGGARGAMVASWVAQARYTRPPIRLITFIPYCGIY